MNYENPRTDKISFVCVQFLNRSRTMEVDVYFFSVLPFQLIEEYESDIVEVSDRYLNKISGIIILLYNNISL